MYYKKRLISLILLFIMLVSNIPIYANEDIDRDVEEISEESEEFVDLEDELGIEDLEEDIDLDNQEDEDLVTEDDMEIEDGETLEKNNLMEVNQMIEQTPGEYTVVDEETWLEAFQNPLVDGEIKIYLNSDITLTKGVNINSDIKLVEIIPNGYEIRVGELAETALFMISDDTEVKFILNGAVFNGQGENYRNRWMVANTSSIDVTIDGGDPNIEDSQALVEGFSNFRSGSGIYIGWADFVIENMIFKNNQADYEGGAIKISGAKKVSFENTSFINNTAKNGGALDIGGSNLLVDIKNSLFEGNSADANGGAIITAHAKLIIDGTKFKENIAGTHDGGAIQVNQRSSELEIKDSEFVGNRAGLENTPGSYFGKGGALAIIRVTETVDISDTIFDDNRALNKGGAIAMDAPSGEFTTNLKDGNEFKNNSSIADSGGAISGSNIRISGTTDFNNNTSKINGGAIDLSNGRIRIVGQGNFTENKSEGNGGAISGSRVYVDGEANFMQNKGQAGGAISANIVTINGKASFVENLAEEYGGAILAAYLSKNYLFISEEVKFKGNKADKDWAMDILHPYYTNTIFGESIYDQTVKTKSVSVDDNEEPFTHLFNNYDIGRNNYLGLEYISDKYEFEENGVKLKLVESKLIDKTNSSMNRKYYKDENYDTLNIQSLSKYDFEGYLNREELRALSDEDYNEYMDNIEEIAQGLIEEKFLGWEIVGDENYPDILQVGDKYKVSVRDKTVYAKARWKKSEVEITFNYKDEDGNLLDGKFNIRDKDGNLIEVLEIEKGLGKLNLEEAKDYRVEQIEVPEGYNNIVEKDITIYGLKTIDLVSTKKEYTIKFDTKGGILIKDQTIKYGDSIKRPVDPLREGHIFKGWYIDEDYSQEYLFNEEITDNITLYARWEKRLIPEEIDRPGELDPGRAIEPETIKSKPSEVLVTPNQPLDPGTPELNMEDHFGYMLGYPDGNFKPENNIRRGEVVTIFFRMLTEDTRSNYWSTNNNYSDVSSIDWFNNPISTMDNMKTIEGYPDNSFRPNNTITRAEFVTIASRFFTIENKEIENKFSDIEGHWAEEAILKSIKAGWIDGYSDETFKPDQAITRAETAKLVNRILNRYPDKEKLLDNMIKFPDNKDINKWYYEEVQEATNSHDYEIDNRTNKEIWLEILPVKDWTELEKNK